MTEPIAMHALFLWIFLFLPDWRSGVDVQVFSLHSVDSMLLADHKRFDKKIQLVM
jgi:hypothetical protein